MDSVRDFFPMPYFILNFCQVVFQCPKIENHVYQCMTQPSATNILFFFDVVAYIIVIGTNIKASKKIRIV